MRTKLPYTILFLTCTLSLEKHRYTVHAFKKCVHADAWYYRTNGRSRYIPPCFGPNQWFCSPGEGESALLRPQLAAAPGHANSSRVPLTQVSQSGQNMSDFIGSFLKLAKLIRFPCHASETHCVFPISWPSRLTAITEWGEKKERKKHTGFAGRLKAGRATEEVPLNLFNGDN